MENDDTYTIKSVERMFNRLPHDKQQELWLKFGSVMDTKMQPDDEKYGITIASEYLEEAKELAKNWGKMRGISSGYRTIDKFTKGFVPGEITVIGGATSNGKTALAVNIASRIVEKGKTVLFVTLEMTKPELTSRLLFVNPDFEKNASLLAYQKAEEFNWKSIDGLIGKAVKELNVDLVIIDHLHYFTRELNNVSEDLGRITKEFKKNAKIHNIPIILISHTRKGEGKGMDDLRGSSYIAQDADIVLMVHRDPDTPEYIAVSCEKNRNRGVDFANKDTLLDFDRTKITEQSEYKIPFK